MKGKGGFTLLELMVVVIIIAILAAIALPRFTGGLERARITEALNFMQSVREQENIWLSTHSSATTSFTDLGFVDGSGIVITGGTSAAGRYFTFTIDAAGLITAARRNVPAGTTYSGNTFTLALDGTWGGGGGTPHPLRPTNE